LNLWAEGIRWLTIGLTAAVVVKLWLTGLINVYKLLFCYLAFDLLTSLGSFLIPYRTKYYAHYYFSAQTLMIVMAAFILVEIYALALERTPALARFLRSTVGYILGIAALTPLLWLYANGSASSQIHPYLKADLLFEQTMDATMAIFLIIISIFMTWFPVRLRRNVIVYISGFIVWSLSRSAAVHLAREWTGNKQAMMAINMAQMCVAMGCLLFWLLGLRREGEARTAVVGHLWNRAEADRLTEQLNAINDSLTRLRRK
jgi:hypothetical protein